MRNLEKSTNSLLNWFKENHMKAITDKSITQRVLIKAVQLRLNISVLKVAQKKLLWVKFDCNLSFENQITLPCKKASKRLHTLSKISHQIDLNERRNLKKTFYYLSIQLFALICIFYSRSVNNQINRIHQRALTLVYQNNLSFYEFLDLDNSLSLV